MSTFLDLPCPWLTDSGGGKSKNPVHAGACLHSSHVLWIVVSKVVNAPDAPFHEHDQSISGAVANRRSRSGKTGLDHSANNVTRVVRPHRSVCSCEEKICDIKKLSSSKNGVVNFGNSVCKFGGYVMAVAMAAMTSQGFTFSHSHCPSHQR